MKWLSNISNSFSLIDIQKAFLKLDVAVHTSDLIYQKFSLVMCIKVAMNYVNQNQDSRILNFLTTYI